MNAVQETVPILAEYPWAYGLMMAVLVGVVIIGGIKRIASVADKVVPVMAVVYVLAALTVLFMNADAIPAAFAAIFNGAFNADAMYGGVIGVLIIGFQRAAFSNEAGAGSAAIAHSAAKHRLPGARRHRGAARAVHRHRRGLHDDGAGDRNYRRVQQPGIREPRDRQPGRSAHVARHGPGDRVLPVCAVDGRVPLRVLDDDLVVVLR